MSAFAEIRQLVTGQMHGRFGEGYPDAVEDGLMTMVKHVAKKTGMDPDEAREAIVSFSMHRQSSRPDAPSPQSGAGETLVTYRKFGHGPLDPFFPHDCHTTYELCIPVGTNDEDEVLWWCIGLELPGDCPDSTITFPPIFDD